MVLQTRTEDRPSRKLLSVLEDPATEEVTMKKGCEQCGSQTWAWCSLPQLVDRQELVDVRFCSNRCQITYELECRNATDPLLGRDNQDGTVASIRMGLCRGWPDGARA